MSQAPQNTPMGRPPDPSAIDFAPHPARNPSRASQRGRFTNVGAAHCRGPWHLLARRTQLGAKYDSRRREDRREVTDEPVWRCRGRTRADDRSRCHRVRPEAGMPLQPQKRLSSRFGRANVFAFRPPSWTDPHRPVGMHPFASELVAELDPQGVGRGPSPPRACTLRPDYGQWVPRLRHHSSIGTPRPACR